MSGTKAGAAKSLPKLYAANPNHFKEIGRIGGSVKGVSKGFAASHERAVSAGRKGGTNSRRGANKPKPTIRVKKHWWSKK